MRGRGHSSSSGSQKKTRMALRKQVIQDSGDSPSGEQQIDENTQEDKALDDGDDNDELSSSLLPPVTLRGKRRRERENKSKPKEMTEEEMMDLALRLSEQEASITALRQQREEEAMIKAIQESMVSQTHPDTEASLRISSRRKLSYPNGKPASPVDQGASQDVCTAETLLTRGAKRGGNESKRNKKRKRTEGSPLLEMPDLSQTQKIYSQASSSSSEVLDLPLDSPQDGETDHHQDIRSNEPSKSDDAKELKKMSKDRDSCEVELSSDMVLLWSDEDDGITPVGSPSPVFPEERPVHQADDQPAPLNHLTSRRPSASTSSSSRQQPPTTGPQPISIEETVGAALAPSGEPVGASTVHYYWGVPFCPRGLDPDSYTQVILAQMEVYEKSLKQAQRGLLQKAEWGEAILPQPEKSPSPSDSPVESPQQLPQRRGVRLRSKRLCDAADTPPAEQEVEEDNKGEEEQRESKDEDKQMEGGGEVDADDCEVCPETQLSEDDDRTQDLMLYTDSAAELRPKGPELPEVEMILQDESPAEDEPQEEEEMEVELDAPVDIQMKGNIPVRSSDVGGQHERQEEVEEGIEDPDVEEKRDQGLQSSTAPELEPAVVPQMLKSSVDCPICQGSFPVTEIEMHAAYCDGEVAITDERRPDSCRSQASLKSRRKRIRRAEGAAEEKNDFSNSVKYQEKCFICQKAVPLRDYSRHTELCIQRQTSKTAAKGNLLSALQKTESRDSDEIFTSDARPSGSKHQPGEIIDLRDDDEEEEEEEGAVSAIRISNSPIRSFTPISEATDCLIDFKKQNRPKKPSQRRR
uniref:BRCA1-A complex subunit RAP80 isoform X8 n=1 Tax=Scatophagus argus TaxID=75038 RepID=UPI001ED7F9AD|nr:BRCA1-A complex subunit RAP80 isoform X8 [Scatophagus argus]